MQVRASRLCDDVGALRAAGVDSLLHICLWTIRDNRHLFSRTQLARLPEDVIARLPSDVMDVESARLEYESIVNS